jgi:hypothetical protein
MGTHAPFTSDEARVAGEQIGIDWDASSFGLEQFRRGMDVELEHARAIQARMSPTMTSS